ncbi:MAG: SURF1 family protein [Alphaproteobacteria bacterium]|nr:SURF1 family protein [Alphaproteobacteria bacterium]
MKKSFPIGATIATLISTIILCALGTWQIQRLEWKQELLQNLEREYAKDPSSQSLEIEDFQKITKNDVRYGTVTGHFLDEKEVVVGPRIHAEQSGYGLYTPLELSTGGVVLIYQGWIAKTKKEPRERSESQTLGNVTIEGTARYVPKGWRFGIKNSPEKDGWIYIDMDDIAHAKEIDTLPPVIFYAESMSPEIEMIRKDQEKWFPKNNHQQYAIFWFMMCGIMLVVYYFRFWR